MTQVGTGFVEIKPDLSAFRAGLDAKIKSALSGVGTTAGAQISRDVSRTLQSATAKVKVDVDRGSLRTATAAASKAATAIGEKLSVKPATVDVNQDDQGVDSDALRRVAAAARATASTAFAAAGAAAGKFGDAASGAFAAIQATGARAFAAVGAVASATFTQISGAAGKVGPAISAGLSLLGPILIGAATVAAAFLLPAAIAIGASLVSAALGAAALGAALAAAFGPVVLVGVAVLAKVASIVKAVADSQSASTQAAAGNAAALDGVRSAMDGVRGAQEGVIAAQDGVRSASQQVAAAQANVREQATAAYRAYADAVEQVRDSVLDLQQSQLDVAGAKLSTKEAQQALRDVQKEAGDTTGALDSVFEKFTDVAVDTSGLSAAIAGAAGAAGISGADQLRVERAILNVRQAKLNEKQATDDLGDSTRKLSADRGVEADFTRRGTQAYAPYRAAITQAADAQRGLATAQRGLVTAQRGVAAAQRGVTAATRSANAGLAKRQDALAELSPAERRFGELLVATGKALSAAFAPAVTASLGGISKAIEAALGVLKDPKIAASLAGIGAAIGSVFSTIAQQIAKPEIRDTFVELANGGARLVRIFGSKVFVDLSLILLRIARSALPLLLERAEKFAGVFDGFEKGTRNSEKLNAKIKKLVGSFDRVVELGHQIGRVVVGVLGGATRAGDGLVVSMTGVVRKFANLLGKKEGQDKLQKFFKDSASFARTIGDAVVSAIPIVVGLAKAFKFVVDNAETIGIVIVAAGALFFPVLTGVVVAVVAVIRHFDDIKRVVKTVGRAIGTAFNAAKDAVVSTFNAIVAEINAYIDRVRARGRRIGRQIAEGVRDGIRDVREFVRNVFDRVVETIDGFVDDVRNVGSRIGRAIARGVRTGIRDVREFVRNVFDRVVETIDGFVDDVRNVGSRIGRGIRSGIREGLGGLLSIGRTIINGLIGIFNQGIRLINNATPGAIKVGGRTIVPAIPDIQPIKPFARGGIVPGTGTGDTVRAMLTPGEYVIRRAAARAIGVPALEELNARGTTAPRMTTAAGPVPRFAAGGLVQPASTRGAGTTIEQLTVPVTVAGGGPPDVTDLRVKLARAVERVGGSVRQD